MSKAIITTEQGDRIAKRLINHFRHKVQVAELDDGYLINMPGADITLTPTPNELHINYVRNQSTDSPEHPYDEDKLKSVITSHLDRMAGETFEYVWQD